MAEASGVLRVDVVSPERVLFTGEAKQVITRTIEGGEVAFLPGHAAFLGALTENHTRIYLADVNGNADVTAYFIEDVLATLDAMAARLAAFRR